MIMPHSFVFSLFVVFGGAAIISTLALLTRQSLLVAYMILGLLLGPYGFHWINNSEVVRRIGETGIIFLLFLLGLDLPPQKLQHMFKKISWVGIVSSFVFFALGFFLAKLFGYTQIESYVIGSAMMFSSTIIGIKLLPTSVLHHQHTGELMVSVLLFQDIVAIIILTILHTAVLQDAVAKEMIFVLIAFPCMLVFAFYFERYVLMGLLRRFNRIKEYLFLIAIAWCFSMAELARVLHLSIEMGAFVAGVSLATSPIAIYIAESLKPVRDFFLVLFFFSVGASIDLRYFMSIALAAIVITIVFTVLKPIVYRFLLTGVSEQKSVAWETGVRLGQNSEFSLIIAYIAFDEHLIGAGASTLIQAVATLTFIISSYFVVLKYPTPVALNDRLRRD
jgi:Kef-type K+ transport system membrane component KefB